MIFRYVRAMAAGSVATLSLLFVMQALINADQGPLPEPRKRDVLKLAEVREPSPLVVLEPRPKRPPPPEPPPDVVIDRRIDSTGDGPKIPVPTPDRVEFADHDYAFAPVSDGPLVAIVRVEPDYPSRAEQQGLEGWVVLEFDVSAAGHVENVRIIESSHAVFERAAVRAALKFRYRPKVVDGIPQPTRGLRNRFRFEMGRG